ncbi:hypothetical protein IT157_08840 [bacterium]|nr:hypothetical protein [bacterium]
MKTRLWKICLIAFGAAFLIGSKPAQDVATLKSQIEMLKAELQRSDDPVQRVEVKRELGTLYSQLNPPREPSGNLDDGGEGWWDPVLLLPDPSVSAMGSTSDNLNDFSCLGMGLYPPNPCWEGFYDESLSCAGSDETYTYVVPVTGTYTVSLCNSGFDTGLLIYDFPPPNHAPAVEDLLCGNDDFCAYQSQLRTPPLTAGQQILIVVDGYDFESGSYELLLSLDDPPPANDDCFTAQYIEPFSPVTGNTSFATLDEVAACGTSISAPGVWYYCFGTGNTMDVSTCLGGYDTKISVYTGDCSLLECVDGNDDACTQQSIVTWCSVAGQPYFILVHGYGSETGSFILLLGDDGVPCASEPPLYTIPEVYATPSLIGTEIRLAAFATPEGSLVADWTQYITTTKFPPYFMMQLAGGVPISPADFEGAWLVLRGVVDQDLTYPISGADLLFTPIEITTMVPALPVHLGNWRPAAWPPSATCDTCMFGVLISGGWQGTDPTVRGSTGGANRADYWDDIADYYCYKRSHNYCEANTKAFYYKGARPDGHTRQNDVPASQVDSCTQAKIAAHFQALSAKIAACKRAGKCPMVEVMVTNHGDPNTGGNQGGITMVHSAAGGDTLITGKEFRQMMQQLVDSGLCTLDAEFGQCFSGIMVNEIRDSLVTKGCNVTASSAVDDETSSYSNPGDGGYNYWLNPKVCALQEGYSLQQAVNIANKTYDQVLRDWAAQEGLRAVHFDAISGNPFLDAILRALAAQAAAQARADSTEYADGIGGGSYFRSFCLPKRCKSDTIQVTKGGLIDLKFSGPTKSCGNCEVLCQDTTGKWIRIRQWNWTVPGSAQHFPDSENRRIESVGGSNGIYVIHSRSDTFYVKATSTNPPIPSRFTEVSNPEMFSGFAVGWTNGASSEFTAYSTPYLLLPDADDDGFNLSDAPTVLGTGGAEYLEAFYDVLADTYWWDNMRVYLQVLNGTPGSTISVSCPDCEFPLVSATLSGGNEEVLLQVGNAGGLGQHGFMLSSTFPVELDCWGFETANSTGIPPAVSDLVVIRDGNHIRLNWTAVPVAMEYDVYAAPTPSGPWTQLGSTAGTSFLHINEVGSGDEKLFYSISPVGP